MTLEDLAVRYPGGKWSDGKYRVLCPAHDDKKPSLGIALGENGGIVMRCGAGCATKDVLAAKGLTLKDLAPPAPNGRRPAADISYRYDDAAGNHVATKTRTPDKRFFWQGPDGKPGLNGADLPLFGLPELGRSSPGDVVLIVEGEKDVLTARKHGFIATTNPHGAAKDGQSPKWEPPYTTWLAEHLAGRRFYVIPDNDEAGAAHAAAVMASLTAAGLDAREVILPGLPDKGDLTDFLHHGRSADDLRALMAAAEPFVIPAAGSNGKNPPDEIPPAPEADDDTYADLDSRLYDGPALMALDIPEPQWLVPGLVSRGNLTLLGGMGKLGKSVLAHQLCLAAASGGIWLDQQLPVMRTLYVNWEDPLNLTRARALQQSAGQDLPETYHVLDVPWDTSMNRFLAWLHRTIAERNIELVVMDPLATAAHWEDEDDNDTTRDTMRSIQEVAARTGAAIFPVHHIRKSGGEFGMELRGAGAIFNGLQGYLSFKRQGEGKYRLDVLTKMPGEHGGDKSLILEREPHTLTWHVTSAVSQQAVDRQETELRIIDLVQGHPGATRAELSAISGIAESTLRRYVDALVEKKVVWEVVRSRPEGDERGGRAPMGLFLRPAAEE